MFEEFYQKYDPDEKEVIVLICARIGTGHHKGDFCKK